MGIRAYRRRSSYQSPYAGVFRRQLQDTRGSVGTVSSSRSVRNANPAQWHTRNRFGYRGRCCRSTTTARITPPICYHTARRGARSETPSQWAVWLFGHLPRDQVATNIADLQQTSPALHYAISLLWSFMESWIACHWEP